jgi:hypothetical protein
MCNGIPIIIEATLYNPKNRTYGNADLLVRADYISKIFPETKITNLEASIQAIGINQTHYRVIDIKSRVLDLSSDGQWFKGSRKGSTEAAYKAQLYIYTEALGFLQGYTPKTAYILGTGHKYTKTSDKIKLEYRCNNSLSRLGKIQFNTRDSEIKELIPQALQWYRTLCKEGHNWTVYPKPCIPELWPNMSNNEDAPFHNFKRKLADNIKEITQIRNCSVKHRYNAHKHGIYSWDHPKLTPNLLGFNEITKSGKQSMQYKQVMSILEANRDQSDRVIFPETLIGNNIHNWINKSSVELYIDFENSYLSFLEDFSNFPIVNSGQILFMIGICYTDYLSEIKYINFTTEDLSSNQEQIIIRKWFEFMQNNFDQYSQIRIFHYGHHEKSFFNNLEKQYPDLFKEFKNTLDRICWIDIYKDIFLAILLSPQFKAPLTHIKLSKNISL